MMILVLILMIFKPTILNYPSNSKKLQTNSWSYWIVHVPRNTMTMNHWTGSISTPVDLSEFANRTICQRSEEK
jgi:hypothetical protein